MPHICGGAWWGRVPESRQLELPFSDPFEVGDRTGQQLSESVSLIGTPHFHWVSGQWRCLANVQGALCLVALQIVQQKRETS